MHLILNISYLLYISDVQLPIKPIFLVKGSQGSNKRNLIRTVSEKIGLNFLYTDFTEVQALTSAQTEAKLRIVLHNAKQSVPCLLCLNNIEVPLTHIYINFLLQLLII